MSERPPIIAHWRDIQQPDDAAYPGSMELLSIGSNFGKAFGLKKVGFNHEVLPPGRRTSWPHAERNAQIGALHWKDASTAQVCRTRATRQR